MKKVLIMCIALSLLVGGIALAQLSGSFHPTKNDGNTYYLKIRCTTEGDYVFNPAATADDTSDTYWLGAYNWDEVWWVLKPSIDGGKDSVDVVVYIDAKSSSLMSSAGNYGVGWTSSLDSSLIATADTLDGVYKKLTGLAQGYDQVRLRVDGITGNGAGSAIEMWLIITTRSSRP